MSAALLQATAILRRSVRPCLSGWLGALAYAAPYGTQAGEWFAAPVAKVAARAQRSLRACFDTSRAALAAGLVEYDEGRGLWRVVVGDLVAPPVVRRASAALRCLKGTVAAAARQWIGSASAVGRQLIGSLLLETVAEQGLTPKAELQLSLGGDGETRPDRCGAGAASAILAQAGYRPAAQGAENERSATGRRE